MTGDKIGWHSEDFKEEGWIGVQTGKRPAMEWTDCHKWCSEQFQDNYHWTGSTFWFTTEQDAMLFALKWA